MVSGGKTKLSTGDTNIFSGKTVSRLKKPTDKLRANKLHLNKEKTCYTVFSPAKTKSSVNLKLNGNKLEQVTTCRYLGVIVDDELNWTLHIQL